jgi:hypothetical protein
MKSQRGGGAGSKSTFSHSERKYEFIYTTYMSLVDENDFIYTKVVSIQPRYVMCNKLSRAINIAQVGNEYLYDLLETGERREWVWQDSNLEELIIIKKQNEDPDRDWVDTKTLADKVQSQTARKYTKWIWSEEIAVNQQGILTIGLKKEGNRFNSLQGYDIVKVTRK